ncbi:metalloendopeptidase SCDLUD_003991 [Saccharomycodes ludwigii]|uniref:metalloendopeptidase n=1 Tax=Saccharomycodes ludwigii TaxID=36035 RepID=UPI001E8A2177|nr:hypothetical protein SCDLUD_003991 [Saccharomycodes ludwigii]KAH3899706.1 hypothetical protein SCDLUD_003991 [Saccharomycodes ludwigii]
MKSLTRICLRRNINKLSKPFSSSSYLCFQQIGHCNFYSTSSTQSDIQKIFDDQQYWDEIRSNNLKINSSSPTGLFENRYLTNSNGLIKYSAYCLKLAQGLVDKMHKDTSKEGLKKYIRRMDELSNTLCRVIDLCEFIRASHPKPSFVDAAQKCYEQMFEFMNVLNTDLVLCKTLKKVLNTPELLSSLTEEELKVGKILLEDFEKSGNFMENTKVREDFITLSQQISVVGQEFINNVDYAATNYIKINAAELDKSKTPSIILNNLHKDISMKNYKIPINSHGPYSILRSCPDEKIRKQVWAALHSCSPEQIGKLKVLLHLRMVLATTMNFPNFASYQLEGKIAKTPEHVMNFLNSLVQVVKPKAFKELEPIRKLKIEELNCQNDVVSVRPWDRDYYSTLQSIKKRRLTDQDDVSQYFSLGSVMNGLSNLFSSIYKAKFIPVCPKPGETWNNEVRRFNVVNELDNDSLIGVIYCDLFERHGKTSNPAHFTVCCSRKLFPDENIDPTLTQTTTDPNGNLYQIPVISLVCNFSTSQKDSHGNKLCFLQLSEVETLFHEMGHAMHSMFGRTDLQNVSGTRCATDFVELPSILMEHFAKDPRVLHQISNHYLTCEKLDIETLNKITHQNRDFEFTEVYQQLKMAILDQVLHTENPDDIVKAYHDLELKMEILSDDVSTWVGKFGHLFGYGALYYSYLLDRAIASKVYHHLFALDPFSSEAGLKFKQSVLQWGGSKDPWECLALCFNKPELAKGDEKAMKFIGNTSSNL